METVLAIINVCLDSGREGGCRYTAGETGSREKLAQSRQKSKVSKDEEIG